MGWLILILFILVIGLSIKLSLLQQTVYFIRKHDLTFRKQDDERHDEQITGLIRYTEALDRKITKHIRRKKKVREI